MNHFSIVFVLFVLFVLVSTSSAQIHWMPSLYNPVLNPGPSGAWDESYVRKPTVIFDGTIYHMWYQGSNGISRIGYATSSDGISWTKYDDPTTTDPVFAESDPVLNPGQPGEWDSQAAATPSVIRIDTTYHMWYRGKNHNISNGPASIGHAKSTDCIHWEKDTLNPVLTPGTAGSWDSVWIGFQSKVLFDGTVYHMWYEGWDGSDLQTRIGHAIAPHPDSTWTKDTINIPVLSFGASGSWDYPRVDGPSVVYDGNIFHMWYSGGDLFTWRIGYATSPDGSKWTKYDDSTTANPPFAESDPVLLWGPPGSWDNIWVGFCSVILDHTDSLYKMWYSGGDIPGGGRIGYAFAPIEPPVSIKDNTKNYISAEFSLSQNYPNPFNPTTNIEFSIPKSEFVTLKVYNILGEEVVTLVSEKLTAGSYRYDWDASNLASGVYFYRIHAGNYEDSKKMVVLR